MNVNIEKIDSFEINSPSTGEYTFYLIYKSGKRRKLNYDTFQELHIKHKAHRELEDFFIKNPKNSLRKLTK